MTTSNRFDKLGQWLGIITSNIGTVVILLVLGHFIIGGLWALKQKSIELKALDPRLYYSAYADWTYEQKLQFAQEFTEAKHSRHWVPHTHWQMGPVKGHYVTVDTLGRRRTIVKPTAGSEPVAEATTIQESSTKPGQLWMFGGSTMWGEGSPDWQTIPAYLQGILGEDYEVVNEGEIGYTSVQELNRLLKRLANGDVPDVVVFYDGVNDGFASLYSPGEPRDIHGIEKTLGFRPEKTTMQSTLMDLYRQSSWTVLEKATKLLPNAGQKADSAWDDKIRASIDQNVETTLNQYEELIKQVKALGQVYGFESYFFWQPNLFSDQREPRDFEMVAVNDASPTWIESQQKLYTAARKRFSNREAEHIYYIGDIFDESEGPIYIDWCHVIPKANQTLAKPMAKAILAGK